MLQIAESPIFADPASYLRPARSPSKTLSLPECESRQVHEQGRCRSGSARSKAARPTAASSSRRPDGVIDKPVGIR